MGADPKSRGIFFQIRVYVALPVALVLFFLGGWRMAVENVTTILQSADSPDGRYRAQVVRQDPGASSKYQYLAGVTPANLTRFAERLRLLPFGPQYIALEVHHEPEKLIAQRTPVRSNEPFPAKDVAVRARAERSGGTFSWSTN